MVDQTAPPNCKFLSSRPIKPPRLCPTKVCAVCRETLPCREVGEHLRSPGHFRPVRRPHAFPDVQWHSYYEGFHKWGIPNSWMVYNRNPTQIDDWEISPLQETSIYFLVSFKRSRITNINFTSVFTCEAFLVTRSLQADAAHGSCQEIAVVVVASRSLVAGGSISTQYSLHGLEVNWDV